MWLEKYLLDSFIFCVVSLVTRAIQIAVNLESICYGSFI